MKRALTLAILSACCCPETGAEPKPPPAQDDSVVGRACENLRRVGCPEGHGSVGGTSCREIVLRASALRPLPLECWGEAKTAADAKGCGSLRCVR